MEKENKTLGTEIIENIGNLYVNKIYIDDTIYFKFHQVVIYFILTFAAETLPQTDKTRTDEKVEIKL